MKSNIQWITESKCSFVSTFGKSMVCGVFSAENINFKSSSASPLSIELIRTAHSVRPKFSGWSDSLIVCLASD